MATQELKSAGVTNLDATPSVKNNVQNNGARLRRYFATDEVGVGDVGSTYRMIRVRASDIIHRLEYASDDENASVTMNVGLYDVNDDAVEDADFFASALATGAGAKARTDITSESAVVPIEDQGKALWEQLSLTDTPANREKLFDIYGTSAGAATTGSSLSMWVELARQE